MSRAVFVFAKSGNPTPSLPSSHSQLCLMREPLARTPSTSCQLLFRYPYLRIPSCLSFSHLSDSPIQDQPPLLSS